MKWATPGSVPSSTETTTDAQRSTDPPTQADSDDDKDEASPTSPGKLTWARTARIAFEWSVPTASIPAFQEALRDAVEKCDRTTAPIAAIIRQVGVNSPNIYELELEVSSLQAAGTFLDAAASATGGSSRAADFMRDLLALAEHGAEPRSTTFVDVSTHR